MKKGIKLSIADKSHTKSIVACSECLHEVDRGDRHCWYCGCIFSPLPIGTSLDYALQCRNEFREEEKTGWEEET